MFIQDPDSDSDKQADVERYFRTLGEQIVRHLEAAGYKRCPGMMMASALQWRGTLTKLQERFRGWAL